MTTGPAAAVALSFGIRAPIACFDEWVWARVHPGRLAAATVAAFALLAPAALAHQPRIVGAARTVRVSDPQVSKAYYARLPGATARYEIASSAPFNLYAQTTVPAVPASRRDLQMRVIGPAGELARLTVAAKAWKSFYEPFGGDHYLTGPEFSRHVPAGRYTVGVSDPGNRGTYVLAIGQDERWSLPEATRALFALPAIKHDYFGQSLARAWLSRTIPIVAVLILLLVGAAVVARRLVRRVRAHQR